jgi:hypothetical protein
MESSEAARHKARSSYAEPGLPRVLWPRRHGRRAAAYDSLAQGPRIGPSLAPKIP